MKTLKNSIKTKNKGREENEFNKYKFNKKIYKLR